ncbi:anti-sigma factor C-terminal domain-containing protein [Cohnella algarum]|nr:anti-sigma factor C-terminal domain-containing protein [Cohnella algarum]MBN2983731.1 anti-sigma factor C-terminal domain-containing protein [Cohnella algarum]
MQAKDVKLLWLAVDTGKEAQDDPTGRPVFHPVGFPSSPIWHDDDMTTFSTEVRAGISGGQTRSQSSVSPAYVPGDQKVLHRQFLKTLSFLKSHEGQANKLFSGSFDLQKRIDYVEQNGIRHYGAVITGPTKEVLKLQNEAWAAEIVVDEVRFWNWE